MSPSEWKAFIEDPGQERFVPVYEATKRLVWTLCLRILRNPSDAEDAFQSAYCRLVAEVRAGSSEARDGDAGAFLCRIAVREADRARKRRWRRARREAPLMEATAMLDRDLSVEQAAERKEVRERAEALVEDLPERYRLPVELHYFHGLTQRDVARALDIPLATVGYRIRRGIEKLEPAFRKAGLSEAGATLAGIAAAGALLTPQLSAASIFARADTLAASLGSTGSGAVTSTVILWGGLAIMKTKVAVIATTLLILLLGGIFVSSGIRSRGTPPVDTFSGAKPGGNVVGKIGGAISDPGTRDAQPKTQAETAAPEVVAGGSPLRDVITGFVSDAETGEALAGAVVRKRWPKPAVEAETAEDGSFVLEGLGKGIHELVASAEGHADRPADVNHDGGTSFQDFPLDPAFAVTVIVTDEDGKALPGARVTPSMYGMGFNGDEAVETDGSGKAMLAAVSRIYPPEIMASKDGYRARTASIRSSSGLDEKAADLQIALARVQDQDRAIVGRVNAPDGKPIPGAVVEWKDGKGTSFGLDVKYGQYKAVTARDGSYRLVYPDSYDSCDLGVAANGWSPVVRQGVKTGVLSEPAEMNFTLEPAHWLRGRIVDEEGKPIAGAEVAVMPSVDLLNASIAYPAVRRAAIADGEGRFELEDLPGPQVGIQLHASGLPWQEEETEVDREADLVLKSYGVIRGRVLDADTGEPISVFTVHHGNPPGQSFSSQEGRFLLKGLGRNEKVHFGIDANGYPLAEFKDLESQAESKAEEMTFALSRGKPLEGVVVDPASGAPLAGVQVVCTAWEQMTREFLPLGWDDFRNVIPDFRKTVTGDDGAFKLLEGRPATLLIRAPGRRRLYIAPRERAEFKGLDGNLWIPLERGEVLSGTYFEDGRPAPGVLLWLYFPGQTVGDRAREGQAFANTNAEGYFRFDELPAGSYVLEASRKSTLPRAPGMRSARDFEVKVRRSVEVKTGEETSVEMGKDLGSLALRGHLTGMERNLSVWAAIRLKLVGPGVGEEILLKTYKDWGWQFFCPCLRPGKYAVEVEHYRKGGDRTAALPAIDVSEDLEKDLEVPGEGDR